MRRVRSRRAPSRGLLAGDWDTHEWLTRFARRRGALGRSWEAVHVTLPDGELVTVPAGL